MADHPLAPAFLLAGAIIARRFRLSCELKQSASVAELLCRVAFYSGPVSPSAAGGTRRSVIESKVNPYAARLAGRLHFVARGFKSHPLQHLLALFRGMHAPQVESKSYPPVDPGVWDAMKKNLAELTAACKSLGKSVAAFGAQVPVSTFHARYALPPMPLRAC